MQSSSRFQSVIVASVAVAIVVLASSGVVSILGKSGSVVLAKESGSFALLSPAQDISTAAHLIRASHSVDLEMYELGNPEIVSALESVRPSRNVRVILDPTERQSKVTGPILQAHGIQVRYMAIPGGIDHVKLLIADGHVLSGGVNMGSSSAYTDDLGVELGSVSSAEAIFNSDWARSGSGKQPIAKSVGPFVTGHSAILDTILHVITGTRKGGTCYVVANYLTDYSIRNALVASINSGVNVRVVLNPEAYGASYAASMLKADGASVEFAPRSPYLHAKVLACQSGKTYSAVGGSANFSYDGMNVNHELDIFLVGSDAHQVFDWARGVFALDK